MFLFLPKKYKAARFLLWDWQTFRTCLQARALAVVSANSSSSRRMGWGVYWKVPQLLHLILDFSLKTLATPSIHMLQLRISHSITIPNIVVALGAVLRSTLHCERYTVYRHSSTSNVTMPYWFYT